MRRRQPVAVYRVIDEAELLGEPRTDVGPVPSAPPLGLVAEASGGASGTVPPPAARRRRDRHKRTLYALGRVGLLVLVAAAAGGAVLQRPRSPGEARLSIEIPHRAYDRRQSERGVPRRLRGAREHDTEIHMVRHAGHLAASVGQHMQAVSASASQDPAAPTAAQSAQEFGFER